MKCLIIIDKVNWAYDTIAKAIQKYNNDANLVIDILAIKSGINIIKKRIRQYDRILVMGWQNYDAVKFVPKNCTLVGVHSYHSWDDHKTTPEQDAIPPKKLVDFLSSFLAVNVVSQRLFDLFKANGISNLFYTPNGVDTDIFKSHRPLPVEDRLVVGYSGTKAHDWRKGISKFIVPAAKKAKVLLKLAMLNSDTYVPIEAMANFYNDIDCYICASSSEGMSLSVLESCACGRPVIGTRVSGNTEIIQDGSNGFLVDRQIDAFVDKINQLKNLEVLRLMGRNAALASCQQWSWKTQVNDWIRFLKCDQKLLQN